MNLPKFIEFLHGHLPEERAFCEDLLENISRLYTNKDLHSTILYRFQIAGEKFGKNIKNLVENDTIQIAEFSEWAKNKLGWWVSDNDLNVFLNNFSITVPVISLLSSEQSVPDKIKEIKIEKDAFLLAFLNIAYKNYDNNFNQQESLGKIEDFNIFKETLAKVQREIPEKKILHSFSELILGTDISEILENVLDFEFVNLKIVDSFKSKKKAGKQAKKIKK